MLAAQHNGQANAGASKMETPAILQALELTSWWEVPAVVLAILYLVLAARENIWCWGAAFVSTAIYIYVFFDVNLFLESALQIYYLAMAVYGWYQWRQPTDQSATLPISTWSLKKHVVVIAATGAVVVTSGYLLSENTPRRHCRMSMPSPPGMRW